MQRKIDKKRNRKEYVPGINVVRTLRDCKNIKCSEDTIIRTEIHGIIVASLKQGKDKECIIDELSKNERYKKYSMHFEDWVADKIKKIEKRKERQK